LMLNRIDEVTQGRLKAWREIEKEKLQTARAYNKKVKENLLQAGDLV
jgi:hypothetical protein